MVVMEEVLVDACVGGRVCLGNASGKHATSDAKQIDYIQNVSSAILEMGLYNGTNADSHNH